MIDFLKAFPFITMEDYKWNLSSPMIRLMSADNTHVNYLSKNQVEMKKRFESEIEFNGEMLNDLGIPIIR